MQFKYLVKEVEYGSNSAGNHVPRHPNIDVLVRIGTDEYRLGTIATSSDSLLPFQSTGPLSLTEAVDVKSSTGATRDLRGQVGELILRLSFAASEPPYVVNQTTRARIWIDDVRVGPTGAALQADSGERATGVTSTTLNLTTLTPVLEASQLAWQNMVEAPDGIAGLSFGYVDLAAPLTQAEWTNASINRAAGSDEGCLHDQGLSLNSNIIFSSSHVNQQTSAAGTRAPVERLADSTAVADQIWRYDDPTLAADGHSVQSNGDASLVEGQQVGFHGAIVDEYGLSHAPVGGDRTLVDECAVAIANHDLSSDLASSGGDRPIADRDIFQLQHLTLDPLVEVDASLCESDGVVVPSLLYTTELNQGQNRHNQSTLQHAPSFGTPTLLPDRSLVNGSGAFSAGTSFVNGHSSFGSPVLSAVEGESSRLTVDAWRLTADQLGLLNQATVTIADLADGYLALTTGTTITLDTDAAGYGWFIDSTPFLSEEYVPSAISHQLLADPDGPASGRIDLLTVLMHELGHVMGLGHVSSAVDGTRLMAGSIDPGIRRLPSVLDLGEPSQPGLTPGTGTSPAAGASPQTVWAPYLTHYTVSATGEQQAAPVINPASLVQAAQVPSHEGILNPNFAISHTPSADFGWDSSGAVTIANGQAVLSEDSQAISTLSQLFTLPAGSTHLRFTLTDVNLNLSTGLRAGGPQDAFEVALLETSTMTPLVGSQYSGLTPLWVSPGADVSQMSRLQRTDGSNECSPRLNRYVSPRAIR